MTSKLKIIETPEGEVITQAHGKEYTIFLKIGNLKRGMPLFERDWNNHGQPCPAYFELNEHEVVRAYNTPPGYRGTSWDIFHRRTIQFRISPDAKAIDLRQFLQSEEVMDLLQAINDGRTIEPNETGTDMVGNLNKKARAAEEKLEKLIDKAPFGFWRPGERPDEESDN